MVDTLFKHRTNQFLFRSAYGCTKTIATPPLPTPDPVIAISLLPSPNPSYTLTFGSSTIPVLLTGTHSNLTSLSLLGGISFNLPDLLPIHTNVSEISTLIETSAIECVGWELMTERTMGNGVWRLTVLGVDSRAARKDCWRGNVRGGKGIEVSMNSPSSWLIYQHIVPSLRKTTYLRHLTDRLAEDSADMLAVTAWHEGRTSYFETILYTVCSSHST